MARPSPSGVVPGNPCSTPRDDAASKTDASKSETSIGRASFLDWPESERVAQLCARRCATLSGELRRLKPHDGMILLLREMAGQAVTAARARDRLEARVAALEATRKRTRKLKRRVASLEARGKPRVRIAARRSPQ